MKLIDKIITYGLYIFVFLLPLQTRWIYQEATLNGGVWEYGRYSLYGTEILLFVLLILALVRFKSRITYHVSKFWLFVGLLAIWSAVTILWSADKQLAWYGWLRLMEGIGLVWLITKHVSRNTYHETRITYQGIGFSLIASGVVQSLLAIWQWVAQYSFGNKWLGMAFIDPAVLGVTVIDNGAGRFLRVYGSLPHPNMLAGFLVLCILTALILIVRHKSNVWLYSAVAVLTMGLFLTFSRAGWASLIICLFVYLIICLIRNRSIKKLFISTLMFAVVFGTLAFYYSDLVKTRLVSSQRIEIQSNQERLDYYGQAKSMIDQYWIAGVGINHYTLSLYKRIPAFESWYYQPVHDVIMLTWAELGIVGLILFILIIIFAFKYKSKYWPLLLAILLLGLFDHYFRSFYFGIMLWWLVIGMNIVSAEER